MLSYIPTNVKHFYYKKGCPALAGSTSCWDPVRRFDSRKFITSDNAWLLDVIANANPVAASDYDSIIAYWRRTNRLLNRTGPDCSLQTVGAFSRPVVGPIVVDFTPVTRRHVRLLARDRQHDDLRPPRKPITCQPFESPHPPLSLCSRVTAGPSRCASWA